MFSKLSKLLNIDGIVGEDLIKKGISKLDPKLKSFLTNATKHGFSFGSVLSFLKSQISGSGVSPKDRTKRPDELAQKTIVEQEEFPSRIGKSIGAAGLGGGLGGLAGAIASPFINSALNPSEETEQMEQPLETEAPQSQSPNPSFDPLTTLMRQYPELTEFIKREAQNGSDAATIAKRARTQPFVRKYGRMIDEIENQIDEPFEMLLDRLLGGSQRSGQHQSSPEEGLLRALQELKKLRGG